MEMQVSPLLTQLGQRGLKPRDYEVGKNVGANP